MASEDAERWVTLRMQRQQLLAGPTVPRLWAVIDEAVLQRPVGGRQVILAQLGHLLELTRLPNITLQLLPHRVSGYVAAGAFTMLRFAEPELPNVVYIEHLIGALYLDRRHEIECYGRVFDQLITDAETPDHTRELLVKHRTAL